MKLRNKKTGEIVMVCKINPEPYEARDFECSSLAELNAEWEDYKEPKTHWYIYGAEPLEVDEGSWYKEFINELEVTGNYFETEEEAKQAVEKLKAWKRLKDKGFRFTGIAGISNNISFEADNKYNAGHIMFDEYSNTDDKLKEYNDDLMLLFRSEE